MTVAVDVHGLTDARTVQSQSEGSIFPGCSRVKVGLAWPVSAMFTDFSDGGCHHAQRVVDGGSEHPPRHPAPAVGTCFRTADAYAPISSATVYNSMQQPGGLTRAELPSPKARSGLQ